MSGDELAPVSDGEATGWHRHQTQGVVRDSDCRCSHGVRNVPVPTQAPQADETLAEFVRHPPLAPPATHVRTIRAEREDEEAGAGCCPECGRSIPKWRRSDAVYCSPSCATKKHNRSAIERGGAVKRSPDSTAASRAQREDGEAYCPVSGVNRQPVTATDCSSCSGSCPHVWVVEREGGEGSWSASDMRDVGNWLVREADQRVHLFPQRRDGVDDLMRHIAASLFRAALPNATASIRADAEQAAARAAWENALQAVAWCLRNGSSDIGEVLTYVGGNNPHKPTEPTS